MDNIEITKEDLQKMKDVNISEVNKVELVDINSVAINTELPVMERIKDFIRQIKNPYCYIDHGMIVKISFAEKARLEDCIKSAFFVEKKSHI